VEGGLPWQHCHSTDQHHQQPRQVKFDTTVQSTCCIRAGAHPTGHAWQYARCAPHVTPWRLECIHIMI
jgi:hypothetical protein